MWRSEAWPGRQRGMASISVLLIITLVAGMGAALLREQDRQQRRAAAVLHGGQALRYLAALEDWAAVMLERDRTNETINTLNKN